MDSNQQIKAFRARLLEQEQATSATLTNTYAAVWQAAQAELARLQTRMDVARASGETVDPSWLLRRGRLDALLAEVGAQADAYAKVAEPVIEGSQRAAIAAGRADANALIAQQRSPARRSETPVPSPVGAAAMAGRSAGATENVAGALGDGTPLRDRLARFGPDAQSAVKSAVVRGIAMGSGPRETAGLVRKAAAGPLADALRIARTETLTAYRRESLRVYAENADKVAGWRWVADLSVRSCALCVAMHGTIHSNAEPFGSHPCCRCTPAPVFISAEENKVETGAQWLARQNAEAQNAVLGGRAAGEAFRSGQVALGDFAGMRSDDRWGVTRYARSLPDALIHSAASGSPQRAFAPERTEGDETAPVPEKKKGAKAKPVKKDWLATLNDLLNRREDFGGWGEVLPNESKTDLFPSERARQMLDHLLKMGEVVQDEADRRYEVALKAAGLNKQVKIDSMFVRVNFDMKKVGLERRISTIEARVAKSAFGLYLDEVAEDADKQDRLETLLAENAEYQEFQLGIQHLKQESEAAHERLSRALLLRRNAYVEVLREKRSFGLLPGEHAFTWADGTEEEAAQAADEAAQFYPSDWLKKSREFDTVKVAFDEKNRANYQVADNGKPTAFWLSRQPPKIEGDSDTLIDTVHEFGHRFEDTFPQIKVFETLYYRKRTAINATEQEQAIQTDPPEAYWTKAGPVVAKTRLDKFIDQYIGKDMGNDYDSLYELLTMGMQGMFGGTNRGYDDNEMCRLILGLLVGI